MMRLLVILVLLYLGYKALMKNVRVSGHNNFGKPNSRENIKPEGTVTIENISPPQKSVDSKDDDYVDFEEVK